MGCATSCCADSSDVGSTPSQERQRWRRRYRHLLAIALVANAFSHKRSSDVAFRTVARLYAHEEDAVRELYERHQRSPAQMRFYAPLLVNFLLHGHGEARSSGELEMFLLGKCESSLHFSHRVYWFLSAFAPDNKYTSPVCGAIRGGLVGQSELTRAVEAQGALAARRLARLGPLDGSDVIPDTSRLRETRRAVGLAGRAQIAGRAVTQAGQYAFRAARGLVSSARDFVSTVPSAADGPAGAAGKKPSARHADLAAVGEDDEDSAKATRGEYKAPVPARLRPPAAPGPAAGAAAASAAPRRPSATSASGAPPKGSSVTPSPLLTAGVAGPSAPRTPGKPPPAAASVPVLGLPAPAAAPSTPSGALDADHAAAADGGLPVPAAAIMASPARIGGPSEAETETFLEMVAFVGELLRVGVDLIDEDSKLRRNGRLRTALAGINARYLPSRSGAMYVPVGNQHNRLLAIHPDHSFCFRTKERVPYMLVLECVDFATGSGKPVRTGLEVDDDDDDLESGSEGEAPQPRGQGAGARVGMAIGGAVSSIRRAVGAGAAGGSAEELPFTTSADVATPGPGVRRSSPTYARTHGKRPVSRAEAEDGAYSAMDDDDDDDGGDSHSPPKMRSGPAEAAPAAPAAPGAPGVGDAAASASGGGVTGGVALGGHRLRGPSLAEDGLLGAGGATTDDEHHHGALVSPGADTTGLGQWAEEGVLTPAAADDPRRREERRRRRERKRGAGAHPPPPSAAAPPPIPGRGPAAGPGGAGGATSVTNPLSAAAAGADVPSVYRTNRAGSDVGAEARVAGMMESVLANASRAAAAESAAAASAAGAAGARRSGKPPGPVPTAEDKAVDAELSAGLAPFHEEPSLGDIELRGGTAAAARRGEEGASRAAGKAAAVPGADAAASASAASSSSSSSSGPGEAEEPSVVFRRPWAEVVAEVRASSPFGDRPGWRLVPVIVKSNDDLRQEQLVSALLKQFELIWRDADVPVWVRHYDILATQRDGGVMEAIPDTISVDGLRKGFGDAYPGLRGFYVKHWGGGRTDSDRFRAARKAFVASMAGYAIVCYLLNIKDRHNGNILIDRHGHVMHIDFGFLLSNSPGGNMNFEAAPFKLTRDFVELIGGPRSRAFGAFRNLCAKAFLEVRKRKEKILLLVEMMMDGNEDLPCFRAGKKPVIDQLQARFAPGSSSRQCVALTNRLIDQSMDNWRTRWYDSYQRWSVGIH